MIRNLFIYDIGWVMIKHPWSLSFKEFYIDYQPWITLIYIAIFLVIGDKFYEIFMCYKSGLDYAEVICTDDTTDNKIEPIRIEMNNKTVALIEAPEYSSYRRHVVFYDNKGNMFE